MYMRGKQRRAGKREDGRQMAGRTDAAPNKLGVFRANYVYVTGSPPAQNYDGKCLGNIVLDFSYD